MAQLGLAAPYLSLSFLISPYPEGTHGQNPMAVQVPRFAFIIFHGFAGCDSMFCPPLEVQVLSQQCETPNEPKLEETDAHQSEIFYLFEYKSNSNQVKPVLRGCSPSFPASLLTEMGEAFVH